MVAFSADLVVEVDALPVDSVVEVDALPVDSVVEVDAMPVDSVVEVDALPVDSVVEVEAKSWSTVGAALSLQMLVDEFKVVFVVEELPAVFFAGAIL